MNRTVARNIRLVLLFACWIFAAAFEAGILPVNQIIQGIMDVLTFGISVYCMWKNNSFTQEAKAADIFLDMLKNEGGIEAFSDNEEEEE